MEQVEDVISAIFSLERFKIEPNGSTALLKAKTLKLRFGSPGAKPQNDLKKFKKLGLSDDPCSVH